MSRVKTGILAGLIFGFVDIIPMFFMDLPDRYAAICGAYVNRFAIGILIPTSALPLAGWIKGLVIGLLLSLPDAIITGAVAPILGTGAMGGMIIGYLVERKSKEKISL